MNLEFLVDSYSICRLSPDEKTPEWCHGAFVAMVRTPDELSVIVATNEIPGDQSIHAEHDFSCFRIVGELDFSVIGIIAQISREIAEAQIPILSVSTFNTDYFLVPLNRRDLAQHTLEKAGWSFVGSDRSETSGNSST